MRKQKRSRISRKVRRKRLGRRTIKQRGAAANNCIFVNWGAELGLGNQLFIYAAGLVMKKKTGKDLCIFPQDQNKHSGIDYRKLFKQCTPVERTPDMMKRFEEATKLHENENVWQGYWSDSTIPNVPGELRFKSPQENGLYHNYKSIVSILPGLRHELVSELKKDYKDLIVKPTAAFMHIRRGDAMIAGEEAKPEYLHAALKRLDDVAGIDILYIITNPEEMEWCKGQNFKTNKAIEWYDDPDELRAMYLMSQCMAGAIISASTFSAWGVMLGADGNEASTIIYPKLWAPSRPEANLSFPERWIAM